MSSEYDETIAKRIASLPDGHLEVNAIFEPTPASYDCGYWVYSCKPADHKEHDVLCSEKYDAHYCYTCDRWTEPVCASVKCLLCKNRPEKMMKNSES